MGKVQFKGGLDDPTNPLHIPLPQPLPDRTVPVPFILTGDEAFRLAKYMLRPYPQKNLTVEQRISNCRISRGRKISENILGILCNRWRFLRVPFLLSPERIKLFTPAVLLLHYRLRAANACHTVIVAQEEHDAGKVIPGTWRDDAPRESFLDIEASSAMNPTRVAREKREEFTSWFNNEGDVAW